MRVSQRNIPAVSASGFTLAEAIIGLAAMTMFMLVCFSGIVFSRVAQYKAKEQDIAMGFLMQYVETVKALPFDHVNAGQPISPLFDGSGGAPNIRLPATSDWFAVGTPDYETFHPDLIWFEGRHPEMRVVLDKESVGGTLHSKHLNLKVEWDSPLGRGGRQSAELDIVRMKDL